jgi:hypothetical protein
MARISSTNFTGRTKWLASSAAISMGSSGYCAPRVLEKTAACGLGESLAGQHFGETLARRLHQRRVESAGHRDGPGARKPGRLQLLDSGVTAAFAPEITVWRGLL